MSNHSDRDDHDTFMDELDRVRKFEHKFNRNIKSKRPSNHDSNHFDSEGRPYAVYRNMPLPPGFVRRRK